MRVFSTLRDDYLRWMRPVNMWFFFMTLAYRQGPWKSEITVGSLTVIRLLLFFSPRDDPVRMTGR